MYQKHMKHNWKHKKIYKHFQKIEQNCNSLFQNFLEALKDTRKKWNCKIQQNPIFSYVWPSVSFIFHIFCEKMSSSSTLPVCFLHLAPLFSLESFRLLKSKLKTKQTPLKAFKDTTKKMKLQNPAKPNIFLCLTKCFIYLFFFVRKWALPLRCPFVSFIWPRFFL